MRRQSYLGTDAADKPLQQPGSVLPFTVKIQKNDIKVSKACGLVDPEAQRAVIPGTWV